MRKTLWLLVMPLLVTSTGPIAQAELVAFTAIEQVGDNSNSWDFELYDGIYDSKPEAIGDASVTSGAQMYWQLAYDGAGFLTYSWGTSASSLKNSIQTSIGPETFNYLSIATTTKHNSKPTTTVNDLVLQADIGVLKGGDLYSGSSSSLDYTSLSYPSAQTFSAFTLTGHTTFSWNGAGSNSDDLSVVIWGGNTSPVVSEPSTAAILLFGIAAFVARAIGRRTASAPVALPA